MYSKINDIRKNLRHISKILLHQKEKFELFSASSDRYLFLFRQKLELYLKNTLKITFVIYVDIFSQKNVI